VTTGAVVSFLGTAGYVVFLLYKHGTLRLGATNGMVLAACACIATVAFYFHTKNHAKLRRLGENQCLRCGYPVECPVCRTCPECGHVETDVAVAGR
jgi:hypothetical protein